MGYSPRVKNVAYCAVALLSATLAGRPEVTPAPSIANFHNATAQAYQVFAQSSSTVAWQVNGFMNEMLRQYSRYFSNWTLKPGARVVVFDNLDDFRAYSQNVMRLTNDKLTGYCHLKTDEDDNTFFELVTYEHEDLWEVLAHEGFHQFLGLEIGVHIPVWLNEGMAQYFENSRVKSGRLQAGLIDTDKLRTVRFLIRTRQAPALTDLLETNRATFYANAQVTYPMSWALVYYLMNRDGTSYRSSTFHRYLQDLKQNRDASESFQRRFGRGAQWQRDFERFMLALESRAD